jgi:hypothetical protein
VRRLLLVLVSTVAVLGALSAPAVAGPPCVLLPDLDGHVWTFCP